MKKINVAILFGGKSAEHEVSLRSAKNVFDAINKEKYQPILIGIDKQGRWLLNKDSRALLTAGKIDEASDSVAMIPQSHGTLANFSHPANQPAIDVVFPILHGPFGEDGTVQGLLKLANVPFVGAGVLGSAVGMDKEVMKRLLRDAGLPIADFLVYKDFEKIDFNFVADKLGLPFFLKPANLGSSVGVHKIKIQADFAAAVADAFRYDRKIIMEEFIKGREIECAVLGNDEPLASLPGEIVVNAEFYSYEAKYLNENGARLEIPAKLDKDLQKKIQDLAVKTFQTLSCEGLGRVDFFLRENSDVVVNEINTMPGFTSISMYPKLWEASGLSYTELIDRLIQLAVERFAKEQKIKTSH